MKKIYCVIVSHVLAPTIGEYNSYDEDEKQYFCIRDDGIKFTAERVGTNYACFDDRERAVEWGIARLQELIKEHQQSIERLNNYCNMIK